MTKKFKKSVQLLLGRLKAIFLLDQYTLKVSFSDTPHKDDVDDKAVEAEIDIDEKYLQIKVDIYPILFKKYKENPYNLICTLVHEISHTITAPLYDMVYEVRNGKNYHEDTINGLSEKQTERLNNIIRPYIEKDLKSYL